MSPQQYAALTQQIDELLASRLNAFNGSRSLGNTTGLFDRLISSLGDTKSTSKEKKAAEFKKRIQAGQYVDIDDCYFLHKFYNGLLTKSSERTTVSNLSELNMALNVWTSIRVEADPPNADTLFGEHLKLSSYVAQLFDGSRPHQWPALLRFIRQHLHHATQIGASFLSNLPPAELVRLSLGNARAPGTNTRSFGTGNRRSSRPFTTKMTWEANNIATVSRVR